MNRRAPSIPARTVLFLMAAGFFCFSSLPARAQGPIATVSDFSGDVLLFSQSNITKLSERGVPVDSMDLVMTRAGTARIRFSDGAELDLTGYTVVLIQEQMEKKTRLAGKKDPVRRITEFVGKIRYKSGSSKIRNCIQTPASVCVLIGSEAQMCNDNATSYLQMLSGQAGILGSFVQGYCENPGLSAAAKNVLYQQLEAAYQTFLISPAQGKLDALMALKTALTLLLSSPDPIVVDTTLQALEELRQEMLTLQRTLKDELQVLQTAGESGEDLEREITDLEEEIRKLEQDLEGLEEEIVTEEGVTTTTTTTTSTTTVAPTSLKQ
jgi:hypothetical protein